MRELIGAGLIAVACGHGQPALTEAPQTQTPAKNPVRPPEAEPAPAKAAKAEHVARGPSAPLGREEEQLRRRGLQALDDGRYDEAARLFQRILDKTPANTATQALHAAAVEALERARAHAGASLTNVRATSLARPPFARTLRRAVVLAGKQAPPRLRKLSEARNQVTDDEAWFRDNGLQLPTLDVPNKFRNSGGNLPPWIPTRYGNALLVRAIAHADHTILIFGNDYGDGRFLALIDNERRLTALFDFAAYIEPPAFVAGDRSFVDEPVVWGQLHDGVLYVSNYHRTYARSSKGQNAYITALDATTGDLLWRSDPLVCNSMNFLIHGQYIIAGYGFTAEPDYLFVLDRGKGNVVSKQRLRTGPDYILAKDGKLHVRTYNTNYVFELK